MERRGPAQRGCFTKQVPRHCFAFVKPPGKRETPRLVDAGIERDQCRRALLRVSYPGEHVDGRGSITRQHHVADGALMNCDGAQSLGRGAGRGVRQVP
jgi:hypothetical protein